VTPSPSSDVYRTPQLISVDWPGYGESESPDLADDTELLARLLADFRRDCCPADCRLIAVGHAGAMGMWQARA